MHTTLCSPCTGRGAARVAGPPERLRHGHFIKARRFFLKSKIIEGFVLVSASPSLAGPPAAARGRHVFNGWPPADREKSGMCQKPVPQGSGRTAARRACLGRPCPTSAGVPGPSTPLHLLEDDVIDVIDVVHTARVPDDPMAYFAGLPWACLGLLRAALHSSGFAVVVSTPLPPASPFH